MLLGGERGVPSRALSPQPLSLMCLGGGLTSLQAARQRERAASQSLNQLSLGIAANVEGESTEARTARIVELGRAYMHFQPVVVNIAALLLPRVYCSLRPTSSHTSSAASHPSSISGPGWGPFPAGGSGPSLPLRRGFSKPPKRKSNKIKLRLCTLHPDKKSELVQ